MTNELKQLETLEDVSMELDASVEGRNAQNIFCSGWPTAKTVLESIMAMTKNPFVKAALQTVISLGTGIYNRNCTNR